MQIYDIISEKVEALIEEYVESNVRYSTVQYTDRDGAVWIDRDGHDYVRHILEVEASEWRSTEYFYSKVKEGDAEMFDESDDEDSIKEEYKERAEQYIEEAFHEMVGEWTRGITYHYNENEPAKKVEEMMQWIRTFAAEQRQDGNKCGGSFRGNVW